MRYRKKGIICKIYRTSSFAQGLQHFSVATRRLFQGLGVLHMCMPVYTHVLLIELDNHFYGTKRKVNGPSVPLFGGRARFQYSPPTHSFTTVSTSVRRSYISHSHSSLPVSGQLDSCSLELKQSQQLANKPRTQTSRYSKVLAAFRSMHAAKRDRIEKLETLIEGFHALV